jgi:hypothetical protein
VVEVETNDSWSWFLDTLVGDLGPNNSIGWTFISNRQRNVCLLSLNIKFFFFSYIFICALNFMVWTSACNFDTTLQPDTNTTRN